MCGCDPNFGLKLILKIHPGLRNDMGHFLPIFVPDLGGY